jgi:20S proteasome subunit beta 2
VQKDEATNLVCAAINLGIFNDLGSGSSNVDLCIITKGGKEYLRNYQHPNPRSYTHLKGYNFPRGHTAILSSKTRILRDQVQVVEGDTMEDS